MGVYRNDAIAISLESNPNIIQFEKSEQRRTKLYRKQEEQIIGIGAKIVKENLQKRSFFVPLLSVISVRPFAVTLPETVPMEIGELVILATFQDGSNNTKSILKTLEIQVCVVNLN